MQARIRGSDVYVVEDIERILTALAGAARRYGGEYGAGYFDALRDVAAGVGGRVDGMGAVDAVRERVHEVVEFRHERTVERYAQPPAAPAERQFRIVGQREAPVQVARQAPEDMTGDDVNVASFNLAKGRLVERQQGYGWIGYDGYTAYWDKADWQRVTVDEAQAWGLLVPDEWAVLVRHMFADRMRRQIGQRAQVVDGQRRMLR